MKSINYLLVFFYCTIGFSQVSALDTSFGNDGIVALDGSSPGGIKVLNDGKILFLAYTNNHISLIRLMTDGSIDSSFNAQSPVFSGAPKSMFVQPDGKVIVLTATDTGTTSTNTLFRFNADGTIDTLFGVNGYVSNCFQSSTPALSYTSLPPNAKITSDPSTGNIFISITTKSPTQHTSIIASYTSNGVINTSFNSTGFKTWSSGYRREIKDLVIDSSGKIVAAGYTGHAISTTGSLITDNWVCRLNADGSMDTTFSGDGIVAIASGSSISSYSSNAVYFKDNGSMVVAGSKGGASASVYDKFTIYEITSNGDLVNASMPLAFNYSIYPTASVTVK